MWKRYANPPKTTTLLYFEMSSNSQEVKTVIPQAGNLYPA